MAAPLPLAAGLDWLEGLLPLLFLLFWVVSQVRALFRGGQPARKAGPVVVRPVPRPPVEDEEEQEARRELARQIEEFVRQASGERARREPTRGPVEGSPKPRPRRPSPRPRPPATKQPGPRTRTTPATPPARREHQLGSLGGHATDVARHVEGAFAHEIAGLDAGQPAVTVQPATLATPAASIAALVRDPATLRQLVLVQEVLERPVHRW